MEVTESVQNISCDGGLGDLAVECLSWDPKKRPSIADILDKLAYRTGPV